jgi:hypothetical protein
VQWVTLSGLSTLLDLDLMRPVDRHSLHFAALLRRLRIHELRRRISGTSREVIYACAAPSLSGQGSDGARGAPPPRARAAPRSGPHLPYPNHEAEESSTTISPNRY